MAAFFVIADAAGQTVGCELSRAKAIACARSLGIDDYSVTRVTCDVTTETIRRLIGSLGGYANESVVIMRKGVL